MCVQVCICMCVGNVMACASAHVFPAVLRDRETDLSIWKGDKWMGKDKEKKECVEDILKGLSYQTIFSLIVEVNVLKIVG